MQLTRSLRRLAELGSRNLRLVKRLPKKYGRHRIHCSPDNNLRVLLPGGWDNRLFDLVDRYVQQNAVVWDIGANSGVFSFPAATKARFVLAIEPDPFNSYLLERSRADNKLPVEVLSAAVSNVLGVVKLRIASRGRAANSIVGAEASTQTGGFRGDVTTVSLTLDWLLDHFPRPDIIKIDAEGAELMILSAASQVLKARPIFILEAGEHGRLSIARTFWDAGYVLHDLGKINQLVTEDWLGENDLLAEPIEPHRTVELDGAQIELT